MPFDLILGVALAAGLMAFFIAALLLPEKF